MDVLDLLSALDQRISLSQLILLENVVVENRTLAVHRCSLCP